jgi:hypothetical protein
MIHGQVDLFAGERKLWEGAPTKFPLFDRADVVMVPFSLFWCGFAIFWTATAVRMAGGLSPFALFGVFFVVIGLYFAFGRLIVRHLKLRNTTYTVTDRRIIVTSTVFGRLRENSAYLNALPPPNVSSSTDMTGTIMFGSPTLMDNLRTAGGMFTLDGRGNGPFNPTLVHVNNFRQVRDIIAAAQVPKPA